MEGYNFSTEILVRFAETDAQGIAHHASFVVWLEVARVAYLAEHAGGYLAIQAQGIEALTTAVEVRYHRAAYFDDRLRVWTRCVDIRGARFRYEYAVEREGELVADGSHVARDRRRVNAPADACARPGSWRRSLRPRARRRRGVRHGRPPSPGTSGSTFGAAGFFGFGLGFGFVPTRTTFGSER